MTQSQTTKEEKYKCAIMNAKADILSLSSCFVDGTMERKEIMRRLNEIYDNLKKVVR